MAEFEDFAEHVHGVIQSILGALEHINQTEDTDQDTTDFLEEIKDSLIELDKFF